MKGAFIRTYVTVQTTCRHNGQCESVSLDETSCDYGETINCQVNSHELCSYFSICSSTKVSVNMCVGPTRTWSEVQYII